MRHWSITFSKIKLCWGILQQPVNSGSIKIFLNFVWEILTFCGIQNFAWHTTPSKSNYPQHSSCPLRLPTVCSVGGKGNMTWKF